MIFKRKQQQYQNLFNDFYNIEAKLPSISAQRWTIVAVCTSSQTDLELLGGERGVYARPRGLLQMVLKTHG